MELYVTNVHEVDLKVSIMVGEFKIKGKTIFESH